MYINAAWLSKRKHQSIHLSLEGLNFHNDQVMLQEPLREKYKHVFTEHQKLY